MEPLFFKRVSPQNYSRKCGKKVRFSLGMLQNDFTASWTAHWRWDCSLRWSSTSDYKALSDTAMLVWKTVRQRLHYMLLQPKATKTQKGNQNTFTFHKSSCSCGEKKKRRNVVGSIQCNPCLNEGVFSTSPWAYKKRRRPRGAGALSRRSYEVVSVCYLRQA